MDKINAILALIFQESVDTFKEERAKQKIAECIVALKEQDADMNNVNYFVGVKDTKKSHWKKDDHFYKVFYNEIEYAQNKSGLHQNDVDFLLRLGRYLKWEMNLLVDEEDNPLNQKDLADKLGINVRTLQRNLEPLMQNYWIFCVKYNHSNFYLVNPYLIFVGKDINFQIPRFFDVLGYVKSNNDSRNNRRKSVNKRTRIKD
jgi:hypothetical protein